MHHQICVWLYLRSLSICIQNDVYRNFALFTIKDKEAKKQKSKKNGETVSYGNKMVYDKASHVLYAYNTPPCMCFI